jgi:hypothetical protein
MRAFPYLTLPLLFGCNAAGRPTAAPHTLTTTTVSTAPLAPTGALARSDATSTPQAATIPAQAAPATAMNPTAGRVKFLPFGPLHATPQQGPKLDATPPDPAPLRSRNYLIFDLTYDKGTLRLGGVTTESFEQEQPTPRSFGRFALELFEGPLLVERMRFNFPLLGADDPAQPRASFSQVKTRIGVRFPHVPRGTRLELVDRSTCERYPMPWTELN